MHKANTQHRAWHIAGVHKNVVVMRKVTRMAILALWTQFFYDIMKYLQVY